MDPDKIERDIQQLQEIASGHGQHLQALLSHKLFKSADEIDALFDRYPRDMHRPPGFLFGECQIGEWDRETYLNAMMHQERHHFFKLAVGYISSFGIAGDYHEYGCHTGMTFRDVLSEARKWGRSDMEFFAFDSFEGMPATTAAESVKILGSEGAGTLCTGLDDFKRMVAELGIYVDHVHAIKGFYDATLTKERQQEFAGRKIALLTVDCDLYESAVPVFSFAGPLLAEGAVIYLDDYRCYKGSPKQGVAKAFREFCANSDMAFDPFHPVGFWGMSFIAYRR